MTGRSRLVRAGTTIAALAALALPSGASAFDAPSPTADSSCSYLVMAVTNNIPPIQSDPRAGYPLTLLKQEATEDTALVITGSFPYATWMQWYTYTGIKEGALPTFALNQKSIVPDEGSTNPYVPGNPIYAADRKYSILVTADGTDMDSLPENLKSIPNRMTRVTTGDSWNTTLRVYNPLPGYDRVGAFGPTNTPLPVYTLVSLKTGEPISCKGASLVPNVVAHDPSKPVGNDESQLGFGLGNGNWGLPPAEDAPETLYPPKPNSNLVEFFRPGLLGAPAPDVATVPPPDNCSGYLTARLTQDQFALIRIPKVPTFIDSSKLTSSSTYPGDTDVAYMSYMSYGSTLGSYVPNDPNTNGLNTNLVKQDATGGATILVWPRKLSFTDRAWVFAYARSKGWNLVRGNADGNRYANTMIIRYKGASPTYGGAFTPNANRPGVPCYQNPVDQGGLPPGTDFQDVPASYAAVPSMTGSATPQGVQCVTIQSLVKGNCERSLRNHIKETGGSYVAGPSGT